MIRSRISLQISTAVLATVAAMAVLPGAAAATTFCVPDFHPACPDNGMNVAEANLENAISGPHRSDSQPDLALLDAGTFTDPDTFTTGGSDPLEIAGVGTSTRLTSSSIGSVYVLNLALSSALVTVRDLTIAIPPSFPDGLGAAAQVKDDLLEEVDVESDNPGSAGIRFVDGGTYRGGKMYATPGNSLSTAVRSQGTGTTTIEDAQIESAQFGVLVDVPNVPTAVRRSSIRTTSTGISAFSGGSATVENSVIRTESGSALHVHVSTSADSAIAADHVTMVPADPLNPFVALNATVTAAATGNATLAVTNSIVRDYSTGTWMQSGSSNPANGHSNIELSHSDFAPSGFESGNGAVTLGSGNIDADPLFAGPADFQLTAGSPAIDAGDPAPGGPVTDLAGAERVQDGNGDGTPRRDMGAFEYTPPSPPVEQSGDQGGDTGGQDGASPGGDAPLPTPLATLRFGPSARVSLGRPTYTRTRKLSLTIANRNGFPVTGRLTVTSAKALAIVRAGAAAKRKRIVLVSRRVKVAANSRRKVAFRVSRRGQRALAQRRKLGVRMRATLADPEGNKRALTRRATLKRRR